MVYLIGECVEGEGRAFVHWPLLQVSDLPTCRADALVFSRNCFLLPVTGR